MRAILVFVGLAVLAPLVQARGARTDDEPPSASIPAVSMRMPADYVELGMTIHSEAKDPAARAEEIEKALAMVRQKLAQDPGLSLESGLVSFTFREEFGALSNVKYEPELSAHLRIRGPLKQGSNLFAMTKKISAAINTLVLRDGTTVTFGDASLGVDDPEQYRPKLIERIAKSIADTRKALGSGGVVDIEGLENPVSVQEVDDREVMVFINYRLRVQTKTP